MKKKIMIIGIIIVVLLLCYTCYHWIRIATAKVEVELVDNLEVEVYEISYVKDFIKNINGKLTANEKIDTTKVGVKKVKFTYINDDGIKLNYEYSIKVVDKTPPVINLSNSLTVTTGYDSDLEKEIFCGDNYDDQPKCQIIGEYDLNTPGSYSLVYQAEDKSKNKTEQNFTLYVKEPSKSSGGSSTIETIAFADVVKTYKTDNTKIGIDVSHWQGDIDYEKVKEAGVEFVFIRVGSQRGIDGEYYLDSKFKQNIEGFSKVGIPVGIYFYSYAKDEKSVQKEARWIAEQLEDYKISLPVAFDWENWSMYQEFHLSFYHLTELANTFVTEIEKYGYEGMVYSSKNYLEQVWYQIKAPIWLAHYTNQTNYQGKYKVWQLCSNGEVDGITENTVDINVMYEK